MERQSHDVCAKWNFFTDMVIQCLLGCSWSEENEGRVPARRPDGHRKVLAAHSSHSLLAVSIFRERQRLKRSHPPLPFSS